MKVPNKQTNANNQLIVVMMKVIDVVGKIEEFLLEMYSKMN